MPNIETTPPWLATGAAEVVDFPMHGGGTVQRITHPLTDIPSLAIKPDCLRFGSVELRLDFDPLEENGVDLCGRLLWTLLEEPGISGVPTDFRQHHLVRTIPHAIAVWSRRGIIIGWKRERGSQIAREIEGHVGRLARLSGDVRKLIDTSGAIDHNQRVALGDRLLPDVLALELAAASPEHRGLRRFLEATGFNSLLKSIHGLHLQASTQQSARAVHASVEAIEQTQAKVEWVEIFVVAVYSIYLTNYLGERFHFQDSYIGWSILVGTAISAGIAAFLLRPWATDHRQPRASFKVRAFAILSLILSLIAVYLSVGFAVFHSAPGSPG